MTNLIILIRNMFFQITENFRTDTLQDALEISLSTIGNRPIYYTTDGSQPDTASLIYTEPFDNTGRHQTESRYCYD